MNKQELLETLEKIRKNKLCAYLQERCDCKYGDLNLRCDFNEETTGCPEMRECIEYIKNNMISNNSYLLKKQIQLLEKEKVRDSDFEMLVNFAKAVLWSKTSHSILQTCSAMLEEHCKDSNGDWI